MNKALRHILSLIFTGGLLISIIGIPINDHYCDNSFISTSIGVPIGDSCGDMPMGEDCCDDVTVLFSVTDYFNNPDITFFKKIAPVILVSNYTECTKLEPQHVACDIFEDHYPPPIESKIFIEIQSFLL